MMTQRISAGPMAKAPAMAGSATLTAESSETTSMPSAARRTGTRRVYWGMSMPSRCRMMSAAFLVAALLATSPAPGMAQDRIRVDGTVMWVSGQTLTLALDGPATLYYQVLGPYLMPMAGPRPTANVDLREVPQSEYAFMRPGERVGVIGEVSSDRRRLIGKSIIRDAEQEAQ